MITDSIKTDLTKAMKSGEPQKVATLRFLMSQIKNFEINNFPPSSEKKMTDDDVISVIKKQVKNHEESIEMYKKGNRDDLVKQEEAELLILKTYLPAQMGEEEIRKIVKSVISGMPEEKNFGKIMGAVMGKLGGKADGNTVSRIVKEEIG